MGPTELYFPLTTPESMDGYTLQAQRGGAPSMFGSSVALQENTAYLGFGPRLAAIDVSQPSAPKMLGQSPVLPGNVTGVIVLSTSPTPELIASVGQVIFILDQPEPGEINPVGQVALPGKIWALVLDPTGQTLYVGGAIVQSNDTSNGATSSGFITTIDVSDPTNPRVVDRVDLADRVLCMALAQKTMLYAGTIGSQSPSSIQGISLDPGAPARLSSPTNVIQGDAGQPYAMQVLGDRLYISWNYSISAYDISHPSAPQEVWQETQADVGSSFGLSAFGFVLHADRIDIVGYNPEGGFVPMPASFKPPQPVTGASGAVAASMVASQGDTLYIARDGLEIYDTHDLQAIKTLGGYHPSLLYVAGQVTQGDYIYSVDESSLNQAAPFLHVLKTSDLEIVAEYPIILPDGFPLMHWFWGIVLDGDRLYLYGYTGVLIFDVSDPTKPVLLDHLEGLVEGFYRIAAATIDGRRLLIICEPASDGGTTLSAYDTHDANSLTELLFSTEITGESGNSLVWSGSSLYLLTEDGQRAGWFYTVALDQAGFTIQSRLALPGAATAMAVQTNRVALFAASKLMILSLANPSQPQVISQTSLAGTLVLRQLAFQGNQLLAVGDEGTYQLITYDLSNPTHPAAVKAVAIPTADGFDTLSVSGEMVVVSGEFSGVEVLK
jgi:hypothetical protein